MLGDCKMKIGIFGGCFNPPHNMHKKIALSLLEKQYLDKIIFVPTGNNYQKKDLIDEKKRYDMLQIMLEKEERMMISCYEARNHTSTYQTLKYFEKVYPDDEIYFICGSDNLKVLDTWKSYQKILKSFKILVIVREDNINTILRKYDENRHHIVITNIKENKISSTLIRNFIKQGRKEKIINLLNSEILKYIEQNNLYQAKDNYK